MAPSLPVALKDLRYPSERNGGTFPKEFVRKIVDGRSMRAAHAQSGMPVWGSVFATTQGPQAPASIDARAAFLEASQVKPGS